jgi:hypothetical protein
MLALDFDRTPTAFDPLGIDDFLAVEPPPRDLLLAYTPLNSINGGVLFPNYSANAQVLS